MMYCYIGSVVFYQLKLLFISVIILVKSHIGALILSTVFYVGDATSCTLAYAWN